mmetsp:Transcript_44980/g.85988  ORF Transcript_44980/g.85988 Transcript_44980/m.85988 type:complete len:218 (+) Transcript_44980:110-763(+)
MAAPVVLLLLTITITGQTGPISVPRPAITTTTTATTTSIAARATPAPAPSPRSHPLMPARIPCKLQAPPTFSLTPLRLTTSTFTTSRSLCASCQLSPADPRRAPPGPQATRARTPRHQTVCTTSSQNRKLSCKSRPTARRARTSSHSPPSATLRGRRPTLTWCASFKPDNRWAPLTAARSCWWTPPKRARRTLPISPSSLRISSLFHSTRYLATPQA